MHKVIANRNGGKQVPLTEKEITDRRAEEAKVALEKKAEAARLTELANKKQAIKAKLSLTDEELDILMKENV